MWYAVMGMVRVVPLFGRKRGSNSSLPDRSDVRVEDIDLKGQFAIKNASFRMLPKRKLCICAQDISRPLPYLPHTNSSSSPLLSLPPFYSYQLVPQ